MTPAQINLILNAIALSLMCPTNSEASPGYCSAHVHVCMTCYNVMPGQLNRLVAWQDADCSIGCGTCVVCEADTDHYCNFDFN